nr:CotH kinase family protein [bacterium]
HALWEKKTNELGPWDDLQTLIDSLGAVPDEEYIAFCERNIDYDLMLNVVALNALTSNGSTYYHNYYMYHDINGSGLWTMLPWDLDKTFAQYGMHPYHHTSKHSLPDNPFAERAFIVDEIFDDFSSRVDEIITETFNPDFLFPIVDSLVLELEASVAADATDDVPDVVSWLDEVANEKWIGMEFYGPWIQEQLSDWPRSFSVDREPVSFPDSVKLNWEASIDPNGDPVHYTVRYCPDTWWDDGNTVYIDSITQTSLTLPVTPAPGTYYYEVSATDYSPWSTGPNAFDTYNTFTVDPGTTLPAVIDTDLVLYLSGSPYFIDDSLTVAPGAKLTVMSGVEIRLGNSADLVVLGEMDALGYETSPVTFMRRLENYGPWGNIVFDNAEGDCLIRHTIIQGAGWGGNTSWQWGAVAADSSTVTLDHVFFDGNARCVYTVECDMQILDCVFLPSNTQEFVNNRFGSAVLERCTFGPGQAGDVIDFDVVGDGTIRECTIWGGDDDLIDIGYGSIALIEDCRVHNGGDKGISVGESSVVTINRCIVTHCPIGMAAKDDAVIIADHVTLYADSTGVAAYEKNTGWGGGHVTMTNSIVAGSFLETLFVDEFSDATVTFSLSDLVLMDGEGNLMDDPYFLDTDALDFRLQPDSPCIDAGDPNSPLDPDGTITDMGRFYFDQLARAMIINEINYNSDPNFDPMDWVEIHNPSQMEVNVGGMIFMDEDITHTFEIPAGTSIPPEGYLVLCENLSTFQAQFPEVQNVLGDLGFGFSGAGELLRLYAEDGEIVDFVIYGDSPPWPTEPDGTGPTLELINPEMDNNLPQSWAASLGHGTPGTLNSASDPTGAEQTPPVFGLGVPYPNPFNPTVTIAYRLDKNCHAILTVHSIDGRRVRTLEDGMLAVGEHQAIWNGRNDSGRALSSGVYLMRLSLGDQRESRKVVLMK